MRHKGGVAAGNNPIYIIILKKRTSDYRDGHSIEKETMEDNGQDFVEKLWDEGLAFFHQGNHKRASEILERVVAIQTKEFGEDGLGVVLPLIYIGHTMAEEGKCNEALEKFERALAIQLKKLGERHVDTKPSSSKCCSEPVSTRRFQVVASKSTTSNRPP